MSSKQDILNLLKQQGAMTAQQVAGELNMTSMGARQHLQGLQDNGEVETFSQSKGRGRPSMFWQLTQTANEHFADRHSELTVQIIASVKAMFGEDGLDGVIAKRERDMLRNYQPRLEGKACLLDAVAALAEIRSEEGYMASAEEDEDGVWLFENHCPICAAATSCQNFCRSELALFQQLLPQATVQRTSHIIEGAHRCAYLFSLRS